MNQRRESKDNDSAWKEILTAFFPEFIAFAFPEIYAEIDWTRGYEFLDKELAKIARGHRTGKRLADKLAQIYLNDGTETWLLIHVEVQDRLADDFERRMFVYNYRLGDKFKREVVSLAVLTGASERVSELGIYETSRWRCRTLFEFPLLRLNDYAAREAELQVSANPFALVVLAQLKANATKRNNARKFAAKRELLRLLNERGYSEQQIHDLWRFLDWILTLPEDLEEELWDEIHEKEVNVMTHITTAERIGHKRGRQEATDSLLLRQMTHRCGELKDDLRARLQELPLDQKDKLAEALLDFTGLADLVNWLDAQAPQH